MADELLSCLIEAGNKATKIATDIRKDDQLFAILVQEKGVLKNLRIDFKTLADVLIQQIVIHNVERKFPGLGKQVFGEEDNEFSNTLGEKFVVEVQKNEQCTAKLLTKILDGDERTAKHLAALTHEKNEKSVGNCKGSKMLEFVTENDLALLKNIEIDLSRTAFWVDPIDGTHHYVKDMKDNIVKHGVYERGLECVTVLMGAYDIKTGLPILGVVYEPFSSKTYESAKSFTWNSRCFWSCSVPGTPLNNVNELYEQTLMKRRSSAGHQKLVILSSNDDDLIDAIQDETSFTSVVAGACGYKASCVFKGIVDLYVCSSDNCYKWDTCATQSVLMSIGGGICQFKSLLKEFVETKGEVDHAALKVMADKHTIRNTIPNTPSLPTWANIGGMVAYTSTKESMECLQSVLVAFRDRKSNENSISENKNPIKA